MPKPIKNTVTFDTDKCKPGMPVRVRRQDFVYIGALSEVGITSATLCGAQFKIVNGVWEFVQNTKIVFMADEKNWDVLTPKID